MCIRDRILSQGGIVFKKLGRRDESIAGRDINHESEKELTGYTKIFSQESSVEEDVKKIMKIL